MGIFAGRSSRTRAGSARPQDRRRSGGRTAGLPDAVRRELPAGFEAVAEALADGEDPRSACSVVGRDLARDGADLGEALHGLRSTTRQVGGADPGFAETRALCTAWAEETLAYLHQLSCEDPVTGLASLPHLRARLAEIYRAAELDDDLGVPTTHALVNLDLPGLRRIEDRFSHALELVRCAETVRFAFCGGETVCRVGSHRLLVLTARTSALGSRLAGLRCLVEDLGDVALGARVWIEGLPPTNDSAGSLLDELARSS